VQTDRASEPRIVARLRYPEQFREAWPDKRPRTDVISCPIVPRASPAPSRLTCHRIERYGDVRTVMAGGGWSDHSAIALYLAASTEARIGEAMRG